MPRPSTIIANDATFRGLAFSFALVTLTFEGGRHGRLHRGSSLQALMRTSTTIKHVAQSQQEKALDHRSLALLLPKCHLGSQQPVSH